MNPENVLEVLHVAKSFGRHPVLKDVTFRIQPGKIVGITGENGAGKSTLLKIIVGWISPDSGQVIKKVATGYCPQDLCVFETLTVAENFAYFGAAYGLGNGNLPGSWTAKKEWLLKRFRFETYEKTLVSRLSGGTKQKLNFSLAVLHSPLLLVLDEPYSGFDWETYVHFWDYAEEMKSNGTGILIVSHFVYDRSKFDTVFELKGGTLQCA